jgi:hypothetical protein
LAGDHRLPAPSTVLSLAWSLPPQGDFQVVATPLRGAGRKRRGVLLGRWRLPSGQPAAIDGPPSTGPASSVSCVAVCARLVAGRFPRKGTSKWSRLPCGEPAGSDGALPPGGGTSVDRSPMAPTRASVPSALPWCRDGAATHGGLPEGVSSLDLREPRVCVRRPAFCKPAAGSGAPFFRGRNPASPASTSSLSPRRRVPTPRGGKGRRHRC